MAQRSEFVPLSLVFSTVKTLSSSRASSASTRRGRRGSRACAGRRGSEKCRFSQHRSQGEGTVAAFPGTHHGRVTCVARQEMYSWRVNRPRRGVKEKAAGRRFWVAASL